MNTYDKIINHIIVEMFRFSTPPSSSSSFLKNFSP